MGRKIKCKFILYKGIMSWCFSFSRIDILHRVVVWWRAKNRAVSCKICCSASKVYIKLVDKGNIAYLIEGLGWSNES